MELHARGLSCGAIAKALGVTRNAVIGKASRLGLPKRAITQTRIQGSRPLGTSGRRFGCMVAKVKHKLRRAHPSCGEQHPEAIPQPPAGLRVQPPAPDHWLKLEQLERRQCRWPAGEGVGIRFCGNHAPEGSYCDHHRTRAYVQNHRPRASGFILPRMAADKA
jgi:GcrA cell cycle regulator